MNNWLYEALEFVFFAVLEFLFYKRGFYVSLIVSLATIILPLVLALCYDVCWWKYLLVFVGGVLASAVSWLLTIGMNH
jgi:hypothetical protein